MYWKEIPVQVQTQENKETFSVPLDSRFQQAVDSISMMDGSYGSDDYLNGWQWEEIIEIDIPARELSSLIADLYNNCMPDDFVKRIRDAHNDEVRDPNPKSIDIWLSESEQFSHYTKDLGEIWT
ncbi:MAG: hypothetical protein CL887_03025 [Dehalococcoidia bacterium]|nr:hypothetical protein [Dehalococcoidia bacterium]|tara:strand:- start:1730 stop:2101 length:372 start_codon:yes stop_codon:yes gene_type:complete